MEKVRVGIMKESGRDKVWVMKLQVICEFGGKI